PNAGLARLQIKNNCVVTHAVLLCLCALNMPPCLHDTEAVSDKGTIRKRRVGGRIGTGAVKITKSRSLIHKDSARKVERKRNTRALCGLTHGFTDRFVRGIAG